jgi:hypothetical protein
MIKHTFSSTGLPLEVAQKSGEKCHLHSSNLDASPLSADGLIESSSRSPFFTAQPEDIGGTPKGTRVPVKGSAKNVESGTCK